MERTDVFKFLDKNLWSDLVANYHKDGTDKSERTGLLFSLGGTKALLIPDRPAPGEGNGAYFQMYSPLFRRFDGLRNIEDLDSIDLDDSQALRSLFGDSVRFDWAKNTELRRGLRVFGFDEASIRDFVDTLIRDHAIDLKKDGDSVAELTFGDSSRDMEKTSKQESKNCILYGPPGTGKTYETRVAALELLGESISDDRREVIRRYDALADAGQIRFVTFHPSLAYEDFVEGLRPKLDGADTGSLSYVIRDGIFKAICKDARRNWTAWQSKGLKRSFAELWSEVEAELESESGSLVIPTPGRRTQFNVYEIDNEVIRFRKTNGNDNHTLNARTLEAIFEGTREVPGGLSTYYTGLSDWLKARAHGKTVAPSAPLKQFVLIIDEINRGNIPAIFGELITLLEPSKRMGQSEPLEVLLPSSQERFQVPPNLHVLGTMNTADRSVEALDVALRRRFDFVEMMPRPELLGTIEDVDLKLLLKAINARLEALVDRDHTIGHAFFMGVTSLDDLKAVFKNKVLPLLQEFFYGDWNRIGLVLGKAFVTRRNVSGTSLFAKGFEHEIDLPDRFDLTPATSWDAKAFRSIYEA